MPDNTTIERILVFLERAGIQAEGLAAMREYLNGLERVPTHTLIPQDTARDQYGNPRTVVPRGYLYVGEATNGLEVAALLLSNYDTLRGMADSSWNLDEAIRQAARAGAEPPPDETMRFLTFEVPRAFRDAIGGTSLLHADERQAVITGDMEADGRLQLDSILNEVLLNGNVNGQLSVRRDADGLLWYKPFEAAGMESQLDIPEDYTAYQDFVLAVQNGDPLTKFGAQDENGVTIIQQVDADLYTLPEQPRDPGAPYIGGIPGDYVSNRLIVPPGNAATFDSRQRQFEGQTGAYSPLRFSRDPRQIAQTMAGVAFATPVHEPYDQYAMFAGKDPAYQAGVMKQLIDAGYLDPGDVIGASGYWSPKAAEAAGQWLFEADVGGFGNDPYRFLDGRKAEQSAIKAALDADTQRRGSGGGSAPTYRAPDYATLSQAVKSFVEQRVGRKVKDYELTLLADKMAADFRANFDAQVAASRAGGGGSSEGNRDTGDVAGYILGNVANGLDGAAGLESFLAGGEPATRIHEPRAGESRAGADPWGMTTLRTPAATPPEGGTGGGGSGGGTVQDVDPYARLGENVDTMFATEIDRNQRVADIRANTNHMMNVLAGLEGA